MNPVEVFFKAVSFVLLTVAIVALGWWAGWWLRSDATNKTTQIYQHGYSAQSAAIAQDRNLFSQIAAVNVQIVAPSTPDSEKSALEAQKAAMTTQACNIANSIDSPPFDIAAFKSQHC